MGLGSVGSDRARILPGMTYRVLEIDEWEALRPVFEERNSPMPDPRFAMIIGAVEDNGDLAGFIVAQLIFHAEPLVVFNPHAVRGMVHKMEDELRERVGNCQYFAFVDGRVESMCKALGLEQVPLSIYRKQL